MVKLLGHFKVLSSQGKEWELGFGIIGRLAKNFWLKEEGKTELGGLKFPSFFQGLLIPGDWEFPPKRI